MNRGFSGGKRNREANRDLKKKQKEARLRRNRELRARGVDPDMADPESAADAPLPEVKLEDIVISVAPRPRRADFGPSKLFVGGLSADTTEADLRRSFATFGDIVDAVVVADRGTGRSRGFGFVSFRDATSAEAAIKAMNGAELDGQSIKVNRAEARPSRF